MTAPTPHEPVVVAAERDPRTRGASVERGTLETASAHLDLAAASGRGKRHVINEDAHSPLDGRVPVYVVADGVGGGAMASRASHEVVTRVHQALEGGRIDDDAVREALLDADREVARSIANHTDQLGAATVALCACAETDLARWLVAWVGDCRVYRIAAPSDSEAELITQDDTYRHLSETPPPGSSADDPARMVGNGAVTVPNLMQVDLHDDEMLVLCSDGVHKYVQARDIGRLLRSAPAPLARRCASLVTLARVRGSVDDATVLVVHRRAVAARWPFARGGEP
jgi:serine/threonine protein phosphatase PrpC